MILLINFYFEDLLQRFIKNATKQKHVAHTTAICDKLFKNV